MLFLSALRGLIEQADIKLILEDIRPLLFFYLLIPLSSTFVKNIKDIKLVTNVIKTASLILALGYLTYTLLMIHNIFEFSYVYLKLSSDSNDFMFRGQDNNSPWLFYKGFLYLGIGFIFYNNSQFLKEKAISYIIFLALFLTFTRGFFISLFFSYILFFFIKINYKKYIYYIIFTITISLIILPEYINFIGERKASDNIRLQQIEEVLQNIDALSILIGHGFGIGTDVRPIHMEITFLEIFHKQGLVGLIIWFLPIFYIITLYRKLKSHIEIADPFLISSLFIYIQSLTNPFVNNSIGISLILISMITMRILHEEENPAVYLRTFEDG